jgi:hypothetical protein
LPAQVANRIRSLEPKVMLPPSDLDQALARIHSMRDVKVHLASAADAALSGSPNDETHRRWFVELVEQIMSRALNIGLIQAFRVQCDRENNPSALEGTSCLRCHVFYEKPDAAWCSIELMLGEDRWFIVDTEMESDSP